MDPLTAGISGAANTVRAATDFGSAIQEGRSQRKMRKRGEANQQSIESLEQHMGNLSDTDREKAEKELARRKSNAKTIRQAGRAAGVRRDENIVSGSANTARAVGAWTSMGLAISGNPAAAVASAVGTGAGALAQFIGNRFTKHAKRKLRKDTVNEELDLDAKISALKNGDSAYMEALGITPDQAKQMSDRDAKHLILKSMGFKSGKRKEAFNRITKNRAKALTDHPGYVPVQIVFGRIRHGRRGRKAGTGRDGRRESFCRPCGRSYGEEEGKERAVEEDHQEEKPACSQPAR